MLDKRLLLALPFGAILSAGAWALDQRYITHEDFESYDKQQYVRQLGDRIDELTLKKSLGLATEYDAAILDQLKEKLERTK